MTGSRHGIWQNVKHARGSKNSMALFDKKGRLSTYEKLFPLEIHSHRRVIFLHIARNKPLEIWDEGNHWIFIARLGMFGLCKQESVHV